MSTDLKQIVLSHISECAQDADGALWCTTHEALMRGPECVVMLDALDLAEAVAEAASPARMYPTRGREFALRLNCEKSGCVEKYGQKHADDGELQMVSGSARFWQDRWEDAKINGHECDRMTRVVLFGVWTVEP